MSFSWLQTALLAWIESYLIISDLIFFLEEFAIGVNSPRTLGWDLLTQDSLCIIGNRALSLVRNCIYILRRFAAYFVSALAKAVLGYAQEVVELCSFWQALKVLAHFVSSTDSLSLLRWFKPCSVNCILLFWRTARAEMPGHSSDNSVCQLCRSAIHYIIELHWFLIVFNSRVGIAWCHVLILTKACLFAWSVAAFHQAKLWCSHTKFTLHRCARWVSSVRCVYRNFAASFFWPKPKQVRTHKMSCFDDARSSRVNPS